MLEKGLLPVCGPWIDAADASPNPHEGQDAEESAARALWPADRLRGARHDLDLRNFLGLMRERTEDEVVDWHADEEAREGVVNAIR